MQDTVAATPATFTGQEPAVVPDRTLTYPLRSGGFISTPCPDWCVYDHSDEISNGIGIDPVNLSHQGATTSLGYKLDGVDVSVIEARITQWPFDDGIESEPHIEFTPDGNTGVSKYLHSRLELDDEIRRVRAHLNELIQLGDKLAEAQAVHHETQNRNVKGPWVTFGREGLRALPIAYLLKVFGVTVVETEDTGQKAVLALYGEPGAMEMRVYPDVSQQLREDEARRALLSWYDAKHGARRA